MAVLNKRVVGIPAGAVYIGRGSKWGNPFIIGRDGDREEVIAKYVINFSLYDEAVAELKGKDLVCYCAPLACHGDFLLEWANMEHKEEEELPW